VDGCNTVARMNYIYRLAGPSVECGAYNR